MSSATDGIFGDEKKDESPEDKKKKQSAAQAEKSKRVRHTNTFNQ